MSVLANDSERRTNAQAIADLATLGWLLPSDKILDLTVGPKRGFWKLWEPDHLVTNDSDEDVPADIHCDGTRTPFEANSFDVVVWDPPYGYRGTSALASDANYGIAGEYQPADVVDALLVNGTREATRLSRRLVLVKCQDQNVSGAFRDQQELVTVAARRAGAAVVGKLYVPAYRKQPKGKVQKNIWGYHSVLLVINVGRKS